MITDEELKSSFNNINSLILLVKLCSFQFRLLHASTVTNIQLKHYGIVNHNQCTFCEGYKETLWHLLYDCELVMDIRAWFESQTTDVNFKQIWAMLWICEHLTFISIILNFKKAIGDIKIILSDNCDRKLVNFHKEIILVT